MIRQYMCNQTILVPKCIYDYVTLQHSYFTVVMSVMLSIFFKEVNTVTMESSQGLFSCDYLYLQRIPFPQQPKDITYHSNHAITSIRHCVVVDHMGTNTVCCCHQVPLKSHQGDEGLQAGRYSDGVVINYDYTHPRS